MSSRLPVSDDIIESILLCSRTFSSLLATILTSKSFYRVFQTHPKSIVYSVAYNIAGPALPQAILCIRHPHISKPALKHLGWGNEFEDSGDEEEAAENEPVDLEALLQEPITAEETHKLVPNAKLVERMEDLFSFRYHDRHSSSSQLSLSESTNFRKAVYHLMLYSSIFHPSSWPYVDDDSDESDFERRSREQLRKRIKLLSALHTPELLQMHSAAEFLREMLSYCMRSDGYPDGVDDLAIGAGPRLIMQCFDRPEEGLAPLEDILDYIEEELEFHPQVSRYLSDPLVKVLDERKVPHPPSDFTHWRSILPGITQDNSQCDRCSQNYGFMFFHRNTPKDQIPSGAYNIAHSDTHTHPWNNLPQFLKGTLRYNAVTKQSLRQHVAQLGPNSLQQIWDTIWDLNLVEQISEPMVSPLADWKRDSFLCEQCLKDFLIENLWKWLRHAEAASGPLNENCWYGYNCRTQSHKLAHAEKLNHLCTQAKH
ncbi:hypothetical protein BDP27DRAFT_1338083 [Rhodocollybia butyracea]|uniref:Aprataxin and PNK-like factor PBZ domain-containing protein n=1 Tax=Rhodocollybia butyracea TaxID=206335 RepID=A0A9P5U1C8_9AGAR|nr:hypothetical protein BDP27DRAFT_1338083 [Rhodocollybia butyracea]